MIAMLGSDIMRTAATCWMYRTSKRSGDDDAGFVSPLQVPANPCLVGHPLTSERELSNGRKSLRKHCESSGFMVRIESGLFVLPTQQEVMRN